jgi:hypothetical protein
MPRRFVIDRSAPPHAYDSLVVIVVALFSRQAEKRIAALEALQTQVERLEHSLQLQEQAAAADLRSQRICLAIFALSTSALDKPGPFHVQLQQAIDVTQGHDLIQQALIAIPRGVTVTGILPLPEV